MYVKSEKRPQGNHERCLSDTGKHAVTREVDAADHFAQKDDTAVDEGRVGYVAVQAVGQEGCSSDAHAERQEKQRSRMFPSGRKERKRVLAAARGRSTSSMFRLIIEWVAEVMPMRSAKDKSYRRSFTCAT